MPHVFRSRSVCCVVPLMASKRCDDAGFFDIGTVELRQSSNGFDWSLGDESSTGEVVRRVTMDAKNG